LRADPAQGIEGLEGVLQHEPDPGPADRPPRARARPAHLLARDEELAGLDRGRRAAFAREADERAGEHRFPRPGSAHDGHAAPRFQVEIDVADDRAHPGERDRQPAHPGQVSAHPGRTSVSCRPRIVVAAAVAVIPSPGATVRHHALGRKSRPSLSTAPHSGEGGSAPSPTNLSADTHAIACPTPSVATASRGQSVSGSTWRQKIRIPPRPPRRAAATYPLANTPLARERRIRAYPGAVACPTAMTEARTPAPS